MLTLRSWTDSLPVDTDGASASGLVGGAPVAQKEASPGGAPTHQAGRRGKGGRPPPPPTLTAEAPARRRTPSRFCAAIASSSATSTAETNDSDLTTAGRSRNISGSAVHRNPGLGRVEHATSPPAIRIDREVGAVKNLALETGQNRLLLLSEPIGRVSVADPKVADLKVITPTQLLLTVARRGHHRPDAVEQEGRAAGHRAAGDAQPRSRCARSSRSSSPTEKISVSAAGDLVVLSGEVSDVRVPERAAEVAAAARREGREPDPRRRQPAGAAGGEVRRGVAQRPARARPQHLPPGSRAAASSAGMVAPRLAAGRVPRRFPGTAVGGRPPVPDARRSGGGVLAVLLGPAELPLQRDPDRCSSRAASPRCWPSRPWSRCRARRRSSWRAASSRSRCRRASATCRCSGRSSASSSTSPRP